MAIIERLLGAVYSGSSSKTYTVKTYVPPSSSTTYVRGGYYYTPSYYGSNTVIVAGGGYYYLPSYYSYGGVVVAYRNPAGAIIGAVVGGLVFLILVILICSYCFGCCCFKNCKSAEADSSFEITEI